MLLIYKTLWILWSFVINVCHIFYFLLMFLLNVICNLLIWNFTLFVVKAITSDRINIILFFICSNCKSQQQKVCKLLPRMNIVNCYKWAIICFVGRLRNIYIYRHTHTYLGWLAQILMKFVYSFLCELFLKIQSEKVHLS